MFTNLSRTLLAWRRSFSRTALVLGSSQSSSALEQRLFEYNRLVTGLQLHVNNERDRSLSFACRRSIEKTDSPQRYHLELFAYKNFFSFFILLMQRRVCPDTENIFLRCSLFIYSNNVRRGKAVLWSREFATGSASITTAARWFFTTVVLTIDVRYAWITDQRCTSKIYLLSTRPLRPFSLRRRVDGGRADHARCRQLAARRFRLAAATVWRILSLF